MKGALSMSALMVSPVSAIFASSAAMASAVACVSISPPFRASSRTICWNSAGSESVHAALVTSPVIRLMCSVFAMCLVTSKSLMPHAAGVCAPAQSITPGWIPV